MERSQNIRQASVRQVVGVNRTLNDELIMPNEQGGDVVLSSNGFFPYSGFNIQSIEG